MTHTLTQHRGHFTGISRVVVSIVRELLRDSPLPLRFCHYWADPAPRLIEATRAAVEERLRKEPAYPAIDLHEAARTPSAAFAPGDVLFMPDLCTVPGFCETLRRLRWDGGVRLVPVVHDFICCKHPHFFAPNGVPHIWPWSLCQLETAELILANSECTRRDAYWFAARSGLTPPPVEVIRLGDQDLAHRPPPRLDGVAGLTAADPFVLLVSTIEVRKNHQLAYHVWRRLVGAHGPGRVPRLVLVGAVGWQTRDLIDQLRTDPLTRDHVVRLHDVDDARLAWLYRHCLFTLYPSLYEGWGLPVAESLAFGRYCIASSSASIPEIGGPLVDYHDPLDVAGCQRLVERAVFDAAFRAERERRVRAEYRTTSWLDCTRQALAAIGRHLGAFPAPWARQARKSA
jgi:glycosyltransferase involved in cell wall biosynthesis